MKKIKECKCVKTTERTEAEKKHLINRLNRMEGQIRGIKKMIENSAYCSDLLMQARAVNSAMVAFSREVIGNHVKGCVVDGVKAGDDKIVQELIEIITSFIK